MLDVCTNAADFGFDIQLASFGGGSMAQEFESGTFNHWRFERQRALDRSLIRELRKTIREEEIEIVHGFQPVEILHLLLATRGLNVKVVQTHQGFLKGLKNRALAKLVSPRADLNISVSKGLFEWMGDSLNLDTSRYKIVFNTVDENRISGTGTSKRAEFGNPALLAGMVANFHPTPRKDQLTVCRALPAVFDKFPDMSFVFVGYTAEGADEYVRQCIESCNESGIRDRVNFVGLRNDVPDLLESFDLFVLSSLVEGLPVALVEAMLKKVPVVASDIDAHKEATRDGEFARLFKTTDHEDLARQMILLLTNQERRNKNAELAFEYAASNFGLKAHFERLGEVYEECLNE